MTPNHLELKSADGTKLNLEDLYQIAPSCFTEVKDEKTGELRHVVNFTTLRQLLGDDAVDDAPEMYQFNWPGKQEARREAARPITDTLRPCPEESVDWDTTQNLYIEGDNLAVLKLLQKGYMGKVKMIYIDPPYNTGNDFVYHDDFAVSQKEMDLFSGDVDEEGNRYRKNTNSNGRFHSDWCSMMYSRLTACRSLLSDDGVIFIQIDDNEYHNLSKICDEVFGEDNFINIITVKTKIGGVSGSSEGKSLKDATEFIIAFAKNKDSITLNPDYIKTDLFTRIQEYKADGKSWKYTSIITKLSGKKLLKHLDDKDYDLFGYEVFETQSITSFAKNINLTEEEVYNTYADKIFRTTNAQTSVRQTVIKETKGYAYPIYSVEYSPIKGKNEGNRIEVLYSSSPSDPNQRNMVMLLSDVVEQVGKRFYYLDRVNTLWSDIDYNNLTKEGDIEFPNGKKPIKLLQRLIRMASNNDSIILDFFSGSASTAHAVMQQNAEDEGTRKFICVQLDETIPEDSDLRKEGFITIPDLAKERIRRSAKQIYESAGILAHSLDTGFRVLKLDSTNYNNVELSPKEYTQETLLSYESNIKEDRTDLDLLFGAMLDWGVQLSLPMSKETVDGCDIYTVNEGDLVACFSENITENVVSAMASKMPLRVLFRDSCFSEDKAKINVFELFKQKLDWGEDEAIKNIRVI